MEIATVLQSLISGLTLGCIYAALGLGLSVWMGLRSDGVYHDDDLTHLQMARWAWQYPRYLLHDWGRPGFTVLYASPASAGWAPAT